MANEKAIQGRNAYLEIKIEEVWYPIFCFKSMNFDWVQDEIEVTSINSSSTREFIPGMGSGTASATGVSKIDNTEGEVNVAYFLQLSIRRSILDLRVYLESEDGDTLQIAFSGFITNINLTGDVQAFSQSSITFRITGEPEISELIDPPVPGEWDRIYLTLGSGETDVQDNELIDAEVMMVFREARQYDETVGTPDGRQYKFTSGTGTVEFDADLPGDPEGESVLVVYKPA